MRDYIYVPTRNPFTLDTAIRAAMVVAGIIMYLCAYASITQAQSVSSTAKPDTFSYVCAHSASKVLGDCQVHIPGFGDKHLLMRTDKQANGPHFVGYFEHECKLYRLEIVVRDDTYKLSVKQESTCHG